MVRGDIDLSEELYNLDMQTIKKGFMSIDWIGVKKVFIHALILASAYVFTMGEAIIMHHDFGTYTPLVLMANSVVIKFCQKFFGTYDVPFNPQ